MADSVQLGQLIVKMVKIVKILTCDLIVDVDLEAVPCVNDAGAAALPVGNADGPGTEKKIIAVLVKNS